MTVGDGRSHCSTSGASPDRGQAGETGYRRWTLIESPGLSGEIPR